MNFKGMSIMRRGATSKQPQTKQWQWSWLPLQYLGWSVLALAVLMGAYWSVHTLRHVPIARVAFSGKFVHVDKSQLVARVEPFMGEGFVGVNLLRISDELKQVPWVDQVFVRRVWPNELKIEVTEQKAIARWGQDGLLNGDGVVFRPSLVGVQGLDELPLLGGVDANASAVVAQFRQLGELLQSQQLGIRALQQNGRGDWQLTLHNGVSIALAQADILSQMRRFLQVYNSELQTQFANVRRIDMRYINGMAVAWREKAAADNNPVAGEGA